MRGADIERLPLSRVIRAFDLHVYVLTTEIHAFNKLVLLRPNSDGVELVEAASSWCVPLCVE